MIKTLAERIAQNLGERIISGALVPDQPLRQDAIAAEFITSHVPVREAFQLLCARGLAVHMPRRGIRVAPLDPASMRETIEIRAALETLALRQAAAQMDQAFFQRMEQALAAADQADSMPTWNRTNHAFHRQLISPCNMPKLLAVLDDLQLVNTRILLAAAQASNWRPGPHHGHREILNALKTGAIEHAENLLRSHIQSLERRS